MRVSFNLKVWPLHNGVRVAMAASSASNGVSRLSASSTDYYPAGEYYNFATAPGVTTGDLSGTLREVRSGTTATGYYFSGSTWISLGSTSSDTSDATFSIYAYSYGTVFLHQEVKVFFSDFIIKSGTLVCP